MITVLLPVYNAEKYISKCIKSILRQTFGEFELLIVDSESSDKTAEIICSFGDSRISRHTIPRCSLSQSLNYGLEHAKFNLVARMDADDLMVPERLEVQLNYLKEHPEVDVLSCSYFCYWEERLLFPVWLPEHDMDIKRGLALHNYICHPGSFFKKDVILKNGGYGSAPAEDYELWLRLKNKAVFANIPRILMFVSFAQESLSRSNQQFAADVYSIQQPYYDSFDINFPEIPVNKQREILGWREFFYGKKEKARDHWHFNRLRFNAKIAYLLTFLPDALFMRVHRFRLHLLLKYFVRYFSAEFKTARNSFKHLLAELRS